MKVTLTRFGRKRRLVLMLEWLTLWPTWGPLAVSSQRRDISNSSAIPARRIAREYRARGGPNLVHFQELRSYRGKASFRQGFIGCIGACQKRRFGRRIRG